MLIGIDLETEPKTEPTVSLAVHRRVFFRQQTFAYRNTKHDTPST